MRQHVNMSQPICQLRACARRQVQIVSLNSVLMIMSMSRACAHLVTSTEGPVGMRQHVSMCGHAGDCASLYQPNKQSNLIM